jgi:predicted transcriptional regulator
MTMKGQQAMQESAIVTRRGAELSADLATALDGSDKNAFYAVHVEKLSPEQVATFLEARAGVQRGLADLEAGRVYTEEETMQFIRGEN